MIKRNLKIVKQYIIGLCCVLCFFLLDNSAIVSDLVEKSNKLRYKGFVAFVLTGLIKYGLLFYGIIVIVILSFILIKEKISDSTNK